MTPFILIGAIFLNGEFAKPLNLEFKTARACVQKMRDEGLKDRGDAYWEVRDGNLFIRAACMNRDLKRLRNDGKVYQEVVS